MPITCVAIAWLMTDSPGVIDSESPPTHKRSILDGLNASRWIGFAVVVVVVAPGRVVAPGTVVDVVGLGNERSMSSWPERPITSWIPLRSRSKYKAWLTS